MSISYNTPHIMLYLRQISFCWLHSAWTYPFWLQHLQAISIDRPSTAAYESKTADGRRCPQAFQHLNKI